MDANDLRAARPPPSDDDGAEEGELPEEAAHLPLPTRDPPGDVSYEDLKEGDKGYYHINGTPERPKGRSRSRSRSPHQGDRRRQRSRSRSRGKDGRIRDRDHTRRDRTRSPHGRRRDRGRDHDRDRQRQRHDRDRSRDRWRRDDRRDADERYNNRKEEEEEEDDEAFQARVAASLAAQQEDEDTLIEERRRRREEIMAKYRQQQQQQQRDQVKDETTPVPAASEGNGNGPSAAEAEAVAEVADEDAVVAELGVDAGGSVDIWRHNGDVPRSGSAGEGPSAASAMPSGIGEALDAELDRRLHAAAVAQHAGGAAAAAEESDVEDDMFAETPEDVRRAEQAKISAPGHTVAAAGTIPAGAGGGPRRGLVDSYDDAEGYYNFQVGEVIGGRYEVFKAHGRGVFSSVLRARDLGAAGAGAPPGTPAPEVAIKVIRSNETMYKAGQMEKVILRKLAEADPEGKRHCIRLLGSFEYRQHLCLVFEPMDMDLRALTKRYGRGIGLSLSAVRIYTQQMLVALHHLHNCGVLHADVKPDNLLVNDRRTVVKLCDFGSAMFAGDNEITPYLVSRFYRAPEVILGLPYDHPMDMWSIGCVVYELFTGQILFPGRTNNEMLKLMMEVKGPFQKRLLKKAEFAFKHFEADTNMTFALLEEDQVTKRPVRRLIPNPQIKKDFAGLLAGLDSDRKKVGQLADLLERMMALDPDKRITPKEALRHPFIHDVAQPKKVVTAAPRAVMAAAAALRQQ